MKQINFFTYILLVSLILGMYSCKKENIGGDDENGDDENTNAIEKLFEAGGKLEISEEKSSITVSADTIGIELAEVMGAQRNCYVIEKTRNYDITRNPDEVTLMNPWADVIWPGGLIQGGSLVGDNIPTGVSLYDKRKQGIIYLSTVSGTLNTDDYTIETEMRPGSVTNAMNKLLSDYMGDGTGYSVSANTSYKIETVHSVTELCAKMDINAKLWGTKLNSKFDGNWSTEKSYVAVHLTQQFFTMAYESPDNGFEGLFTDDIKVSDLSKYTGAGNPLCYVSSVTYGRIFILLYESEASSTELKASLNAAFRNNSVEASTQNKEILNSSSCTLLQIGGDPVAGLETTFGDFDALKKFVIGGAIVSATNVGAPISFKINRVYDNMPTRLSNMLKYSFTERSYVPVYSISDIEIDIKNAKVSAPRSSDNISNNSRFTMKQIRVGYHSKNGFLGEEGTSIYKVNDLDTSSRCHKNGYDIPIGKIFTLTNISEEQAITIECSFTAKNETWRRFHSNKVGEETVTLSQTFYYDKNAKTWKVVNNNNSTAFETLGFINRELGNTLYNFELNFGFKYNNEIYPVK
ncbi:MAG: thiol-activated cytolysin family protein [Mangrovibacterium sp.]